MNDYAQLAEKLFTGGTVLFGIAALLCQSSWSTLMRFLSNYPEARKPFKLFVRNLPVKEKLIRDESASLLLCILFFALACFAALGSIWQSAAYMLHMGNLGFFSQDYSVGKWSLLLCVAFLVFGFFCLAVFYGGEFKRIIKGRHPISESKTNDAEQVNTDSKTSNTE